MLSSNPSRRPASDSRSSSCWSSPSLTRARCCCSIVGSTQARSAYDVALTCRDRGHAPETLGGEALVPALAAPGKRLHEQFRGLRFLALEKPDEAQARQRHGGRPPVAELSRNLEPFVQRREGTAVVP